MGFIIIQGFTVIRGASLHFKVLVGHLKNALQGCMQHGLGVWELKKAEVMWLPTHTSPLLLRNNYKNVFFPPKWRLLLLAFNRLQTETSTHSAFKKKRNATYVRYINYHSVRIKAELPGSVCVCGFSNQWSVVENVSVHPCHFHQPHSTVPRIWRNAICIVSERFAQMTQNQWPHVRILINENSPVSL